MLSSPQRVTFFLPFCFFLILPTALRQRYYILHSERLSNVYRVTHQIRQSWKSNPVSLTDTAPFATGAQGGSKSWRKRNAGGEDIFALRRTGEEQERAWWVRPINGLKVAQTLIWISLLTPCHLLCVILGNSLALDCQCPYLVNRDNDTPFYHLFSGLYLGISSSWSPPWPFTPHLFHPFLNIWYMQCTRHTVF